MRNAQFEDGIAKRGRDAAVDRSFGLELFGRYFE